MRLPERFPSRRLALPIKVLYWSCRVTRNDWLGAALLPCVLVGVGLALLLPREEVSRGMWLALLWASTTFGMLYYGLHRIQRVFDELSDVIPKTAAAKSAEEDVRAGIYAHGNNGYYYLVSAIVIALTFPIMHERFIAHYSSALLRAWGWVFFIYIAFVGGYGMACGVAFNRIVRDVLDSTPFELDPYHPDLFMGLKPVGQLSVVVAFLASSSSLLFPLIFEAAGKDASTLLAYLIFGIVVAAIVVSFIGPLFIIKGKVEREKFKALVANEREYQERLDGYKRAPTSEGRDTLHLLTVEKAKLKEIRLFPFETKMMSQIVISILLPIVMLLLQLHFK